MDVRLLRPFNPPFIDTSILVLSQVPSQFSIMSRQSYTLERDEPTLGLVRFPSTIESFIVPIIV